VRDWLSKSIARRLALAAAITTAALLGVGEAALHRHWASDLVLGLTLPILIAFGVWLAVRRMFGQPLGALAETMRRAESGELLVRARAERADEIGALARSFNKLLAKITDLNVSVIDSERMVEVQRRELSLLEELAEKERVLSEANRQMEQSLRELSLLFDITRTMNSTLELHEVLRSICTRVGETLGFEECAILLVERDRLVVSATYGFPADEQVEGMSFAAGEGISGIVARTGEWLLIPDTSRDTRYLHYKGRHLTDGSFVCVPMKLQERLIGLFNVLRPRTNAFSEGDIRLLTSLANFAALALANAQLHGRIKELSVTDELTQLANRRRLLEQAEMELDRASRYGHPVACLVIDIDHFKQFNDARGHLRGDEVLRGVAKALQQEVRNVDLCARYGGEEFVVLLPQIGRGDALRVAEKLRAAVAARPFDQPITISIGVAVYPEDAHAVTELLEAADRALFEAKRAGRNRVVGWTSELPIATAPHAAAAP
jgi:diguanylate cyclase (GGDEF)-like protein